MDNNQVNDVSEILLEVIGAIANNLNEYGAGVLRSGVNKKAWQIF